ncbi:hypothetical protein PFDSM3638_05465 [Pyrococcus furiosus DSM 3638]|uniref:DUF3267 domain-containing protein n=3 Tax=Pyrococcus furiosus TaxID=2261 RepID=A0A5C0XP26_PYRFU|nr:MULTISPECIES: hypothetical protein [Pyrococcus]AAL81215.1 hypothetical protein PF1091 [Pyrococcus furiosus DSM 3638]AFN03883.1 hypothetical protein PFC_04680 [Pyrococcus furiosus COM1]MDK2868787.1 hypothetical protein [Pyrococcus sp.]QEK78747.1 hypothetical protein PFDSM3638_05465 [Pyrococcus furiosus DSM 3638]
MKHYVSFFKSLTFFTIYLAGLITVIPLGITYIVGVRTLSCVLSFILKNFTIPVIGAVYLHEVAQYLPISSPVEVRIDYKKLAFIWIPQTDIPNQRYIIGWILGFLLPFVFGLLLIEIGYGLTGIIFLIISLSGLRGLWEGAK